MDLLQRKVIKQVFEEDEGFKFATDTLTDLKWGKA